MVVIQNLNLSSTIFSSSTSWASASSSSLPSSLFFFMLSCIFLVSTILFSKIGKNVGHMWQFCNIIHWPSLRAWVMDESATFSWPLPNDFLGVSLSVRPLSLANLAISASGSAPVDNINIIGVNGFESSNAEFKLNGGASMNSLLPYYSSKHYLIDLTTNSGLQIRTIMSLMKLYMCCLI